MFNEKTHYFGKDGVRIILDLALHATYDAFKRYTRSTPIELPSTNALDP